MAIFSSFTGCGFLLWAKVRNLPSEICYASPQNAVQAAKPAEMADDEIVTRLESKVRTNPAHQSEFGPPKMTLP
jgi:hypothetical protein